MYLLSVPIKMKGMPNIDDAWKIFEFKKEK